MMGLGFPVQVLLRLHRPARNKNHYENLTPCLRAQQLDCFLHIYPLVPVSQIDSQCLYLNFELT
jgi:hypothetical protein